MRGNAFRFLCNVIWNTDEPPFLKHFENCYSQGKVEYSPCNYNRVSQKENPDPIPSFAVSLDDLVSVRDPVLVPAPDCRTIMDSEYVDILNLKTGSLELAHNPAERARGVGTGEDIFVHEQAPAESELVFGQQSIKGANQIKSSYCQ